jgi:3-phosphoshikimate 1-carboxyvinyltransferase
MHERPQAALFDALRQLGYTILSGNNRLPAVIVGRGAAPGNCQVSILESSQFASALVLGAKTGGWQIEVAGENADESPYVAMTQTMVDNFPGHGGDYAIEPDASGGSYFWAANWLLHPEHPSPVVEWPVSGMQIDAAFPKYLPLPDTISRRVDLADSIMTAMILAPFGTGPVRFTDLGRLRVQECERVRAMKTELARCGARVEETGDTLMVWPSPLHGARIETYDDHRMAMCFAILGLKTPGIQIRNPSCVNKTFPNFFNKLAQAAPGGLNAEIRDAATGTRLTELLAE